MLTPMILSSILSTSDNHKVSYEHYKYGHNKVVVIAHGFFCSKDVALIKKLKDALIDNYDVIAFDFRGHGRSSGLFSWTAKERRDLEAVLDYARSRYDKIGLIGFSLGAAISVDVLASTDKADSFIAVSPPLEFNKINFSFWDLDIENDIFYNLGEGRTGKGVRPGAFWLKKPKPIELVKEIRIPILYIHGDKDWVIGHQHSQKLYDKTQSPKKEIHIIKNGPHAEYLIRKNAKEVLALIRQWFKETLEGREDK